MKNNLYRAYTLIELMVAVGIIAILATTGAAIFLRTLRGSSQTEIRRTLDDRARLITDGMSRYFEEGVIVSMTDTSGTVQTRSDCLASGEVDGDSLVIAGLDNLNSTISVSAGIISSAAAQINPETVTVSHKTGLGYYFSWYCANGTPDRLVMQFTAASVGQQGDTSVNNDYRIDVTMRNSGQ